jgi:hypothetical protein
MRNQTNGGPAFPVTPDNDVRTNGAGGTGMTLRDYFAAKAVQALLQISGPDDVVSAADYSKMAYEVADAMLAARGEA